MKIDNFNGFLSYKDETCPFSFMNYNLTIHPSSIEKWEELKGEWFHFTSVPRNKWTNKIIIEGITQNNTGVYFFVTDNPLFSNGYFTYKVDYMYIYKINPSDGKMYDINGLKFSSPEINYFHDVSDYLEQDLKLKENTFDEYSLVLKSKKDKNFGKFRWHNYSINLKGSLSWKKENDTYGPLNINSLLIFDFSRKCNDLKKIIELINIQKSMLYFLCYRKNITFSEIQTYSYNSNGSRFSTGKIYIFDDNNNFEEKKESIKQIIDLSNTNKSFTKLYELNIKNKLYFSHILNNSFERSIYTPARMLSILIAFEHYFKIFYPDVNIQSEEFETAKSETTSFLKDKIQHSTGKLKKKYKSLNSSINKIDVGYGERLKYALNDNYNILKPFISRRFKVKQPKRIVSACSERINVIRNSMAHGNLDLKFKPINTNDIYIIELLLYSMVLKSVGLDTDVIQEKIKRLFNLKF